MGVAIFIISIPFFIFAITLSKGKGASILTGYNTMSDSEKAQYDEVALCKFMGKIMCGFSFSILIIALSEMLENQVLLIIGIVLLITLLIFALVYSNTKRQIQKESLMTVIKRGLQNLKSLIYLSNSTLFINIA